MDWALPPVPIKTLGRTPWATDRPAERPYTAPVKDGTTQSADRTSMTEVGLKRTTSVREIKIIHSAATLITHNVIFPHFWPRLHKILFGWMDAVCWTRGGIRMYTKLWSEPKRNTTLEDLGVCGRVCNGLIWLDTNQWPVLANSATNIRVPLRGNFLTCWATISFSKMTLLHNVSEIKEGEMRWAHSSDWRDKKLTKIWHGRFFHVTNNLED